MLSIACLFFYSWSLELQVQQQLLLKVVQEAPIQRRPMNTPVKRWGFVPSKHLRIGQTGRRTASAFMMPSRAEKSTRENHYSPRVVILNDVDIAFNHTVPIHGKGQASQRFELPMNHPLSQHKDSADGTVLDFERPFYDQCTPKANNLRAHPTCNSLHEVHLVDDDTTSLLSTKGSWRSVWNIQQNTTVLKMLHFHRPFSTEAYQFHAMDAIVMDQLTASPHIVQAHGFCGPSVLTEKADRGGRDHVKSYDLRNRDRLKIARDLAQGLADLQSLRYWKKYNEHPVLDAVVFAHNDINIANTVHSSDGRVKWNDFNIGVLLRKDRRNDTNCLAPVHFRADLWRSPEEVRNTSYVALDQADVYGFGNILYQIMTRHQPWTHKEVGGMLSLEEIARRKSLGRLPTIPEQYLNTTKLELQALVMATVSCYNPNPARRPSAYELARALTYVYDRVKAKKRVPPGKLKELFWKEKVERKV